MQDINKSFPEIDSLLKDFTPWENSTSPSYPCNRYTLRRNLAGFNFPETINEKDAKYLTDKLVKILTNLYPDGYYFSGESISGKSAHLLFEHLFLPNRESINSCGGVYIDPKEKVIALLHLDDHITLFYYDTNSLNSQLLVQIQALDEKIGEDIPLAFSEKFGYITSSCLTLGTGLTLESMIHAPTINILNKDIDAHSKIIIHGLHNEKQVLHNLVIASNKYYLGISEKNNLAKLNEIAKEIHDKELSLRGELKKEPSKELIDKLHKNYGIATFCKKLSFHESLEIASLLDLSISLDLIKSDCKTLFFDLFFSLRRAHIEAYYSDENRPIEEKRALFLQQKIKDLNLTI